MSNRELERLRDEAERCYHWRNTCRLDVAKIEQQLRTAREALADAEDAHQEAQGRFDRAQMPTQAIRSVA